MKRRNFIKNVSFGSFALANSKEIFGSNTDKISEKANENLEIIFKNLASFQPLSVKESQTQIEIEGNTFIYKLSKMNGLINSICVLGDEWITGYIPDLWVSSANDPLLMQYFAKFTPFVNVNIVESLSYRVIISTFGEFATSDKSTLPLKWNLLYTFDIDGTVKVDVEISAKKNVVLRWLTLMEGRISDKFCDFASHEYDLGRESKTCSPTNYDIINNHQINCGGRYIPWFHFGNDKSGIELIFPNSDKRFASYTDTSPFPGGDPLGKAYDLFALRKENHCLTLTSFGIRNLREVIGPRYSFKDYFYISVLPSHEVPSKTNSIQIQWIGPHQYVNNWKHPSEKDIKEWAANGINTIVGGANWFSGDYSHCSMPEETKQFLDICHYYGLRVVPYVTFTDQEYRVPHFDETGPKWRIEPVVEFNYRSQLMCYGSEEWIEHWKNEIKNIFDQFPFDGLYIDFWAGKLNCYNTKHGCIGPYGRFTVEGLRKMVRIAREVVDTKTENGLILSNTNILPLAMINNWIDARLYGEWHNLVDTDPLSLRIYYNSHRYGTGNVLLVSKVPKITEQTLSLAGLFQGNPVISNARTLQERSLLERNALLLQAFGVNQSNALNKFEIGEIKFSLNEKNAPQVSLYYHPHNNEILIFFSSFRQTNLNFRLGYAMENILEKVSNYFKIENFFPREMFYYFYIFEDKELIGGKSLTFDDLASYTLELPAESYRNVWIKPDLNRPTLLYSLNNGNKPLEEFNSKINELVVTVFSQSRSSAETVILGENPKMVKVQNKKVHYTPHKGWWEADLPCNSPVKIAY